MLGIVATMDLVRQRGASLASPRAAERTRGRVDRRNRFMSSGTNARAASSRLSF